MSPRRLAFAVPGGVDLPTGGATYDRKVIEGLRALGWRVELIEWSGRFPFPTKEDRVAAAASLAALPDGTLVLIDGLALGVLPDLAEREAGRLRLAAMVHHPLALETGSPPDAALAFTASERRALAFAQAVIVSSATTAATLERDYSVSLSVLTVAVPGVTAIPRPPRAPGPPRLFSMGSFTPRKAHPILVEALGKIADLDWSSVIAGDLERDPQAAADLRRLIAGHGLAARVRLVGQVSEDKAARLYAEADLFVLASLYEGYGMVFGEALAAGLPIVATTGGAIPEVVPSQAGLLVTPGDADALAAALRLLLEDSSRLAALAQGAAAAGARLTDWGHTAATIAAVLERL